MHSSIRILLIDDSEAQFFLVENWLLQSSYLEFHLDWVVSLSESMALLQKQAYDVCLLDYNLGDTTALEILATFQQQNITTPVIVITGHDSRDIDMAVMQAGAVDYIEKSQLNVKNLERALRYAVQQAHNLELLRRSEERFRMMVEKASDLIIQLDSHGNFLYTSPSITRCLGYSETELINQPLADYVFKEDAVQLTDLLNISPKRSDVALNVQFRIKTKSEAYVWFECVATNLLNIPGVESIIINGRDITERYKRLEAEKQQHMISDVLLDTSITLNSTLNFDDVIARLLENVRDIIPHQRANIMLIDENHRAQVVAQCGYSHTDLALFEVDVREFPTFMGMIETARPLLIHDIEQSPLWRVIDKDLNSRSYLGAPIVAKEGTIGFINLEGNDAGLFNEDHISHLLLFSNLASAAIVNARNYQQGRELAALEERQRLARELHDAISQTLFSSSVIADSLTKLDLTNTEKIHTGLEKITQLNRGALAEMRAMLIELRPQAIINSPLSDLVVNLSNTLKTRSLIDAELEVEGVSKIFAPDVQLQLYRLTQEVLNNISKHAKAKLVNIVLRCREDSVEIVIADDGIGFDLEKIPPVHHGIAIMRERAEKIGAILTIDTAPNEGTYVHIEWQERVRLGK